MKKTEEKATKKSVKVSEEYKQGTRFIVILAVIGIMLITLVGYVVYLEMYGKYAYMEDTKSETVQEKVLKGEITSADGEVLLWNKWITSVEQEERKSDDYDDVFLPLLDGVKTNMAKEYTGIGELLENKYEAKGENIQLTIHADLQRKAHEIFHAKNPNNLGAVVALDPNTGEILCAYTHRIAIDGVLTQRNVAFEAAYAPGSTMKVLWAGAAMDERKTIDEHKPFDKPDYYGVRNLSGNKVRADIPKTVDMEKAVQYSVNTYFAQLAVEEFNADLMCKYADKLFLGRTLNVAGYGEVKGSLDKGEDGIAHLQNWGIGHEMRVSPLHMAMLAATVANDGVVLEPYLVNQSVRYNEEVSFKNYTKNAGRLFRSGTAKKLKNYMILVANAPGGTAYGRATSRVTKIAGKTGTANNNDAWFIGFAPANNPKIAVAVFVEKGGGGGAVAAPIAKELIEYYITSEGK
ncbi:MAG: hypothetical protein IKJ55_00350 [Clostridia bacterium]|nr:hypothetical protein [Clostridia bacterium]